MYARELLAEGAFLRHGGGALVTARSCRSLSLRGGSPRSLPWETFAEEPPRKATQPPILHALPLGVEAHTRRVAALSPSHAAAFSPLEAQQHEEALRNQARNLRMPQHLNEGSDPPTDPASAISDTSIVATARIYVLKADSITS